jgi:hypothetical protein
MTTPLLQQIGELLGEAGVPGTFTARRTATAEDLHIEVRGLGRLRFPVSRAQAQQLVGIARPASYGRGEQTLFDRRVRDTWEIPKSRVKIDRRRWRRTLAPVLEAMRADLGLPDGCRLRAELHGMLLYGPGQFFLRHQDSEKADEMIGTLVVTLPSSFTGGAIVVEHHGESVAYRASRQPLSFIAFYADCHHEVRLVRSGYRIVLTYDLMLDSGGTAAAGGSEQPPAQVDALAARLREHFETPLPGRPYLIHDAALREPPNRLVYLLDHQYTERSLGWPHLKGTDAARAALLRAGAERAGCEIVLALAEVHEVWDCMEDDSWGGYGYSGRRGRERYADDYDDDQDGDDANGLMNADDSLTLGDLIDSDITLRRWIDPSGRKTDAVLTDIAREEVCFTTPSSSLAPYEQEYEGYMGNYGNTMDRWYRRAALVLWPAERAFAVRAKASPGWALAALTRRMRSGGVPEARELAASLLPFWKSAALHAEQRGFFQKALRVAAGLDAPALAAALLEPFRVEELTAALAPELVALAQRYDQGWMKSLLVGWFGFGRDWSARAERGPLAWAAAAPRLGAALRACDEIAGTLVAQRILQLGLRKIEEEVKAGSGHSQPSQRAKALAALAGPILSWLESAAVIQAAELRDQAVTMLCAREDGALLGCLVQILRLAAERTEPAKRAALGLDALQLHCSRELNARLERPPRDENDWSIALPAGCDCELCSGLSAFLADPRERQLEWPLAKNGRQHVHIRLDAHELPVLHQTWRSGRPFTLVLEKTMALFDHEAAERRALQADLEWLAAPSPAGARTVRRSRIRTPTAG